jgi:hypothetical protein
MMKNFRNYFVLSMLMLSLMALFACGGGGGGGGAGGEGSSPAITGGVFGTGDFVVTVADGSIPPDAAAAPVAAAAGALPADIMVSSYETNVTSGAKAYTLKIGGMGFSTSTPGNVRLEVPFDPGLVPDQTKLDSLHLLLRILNAEDNSVVDLTGQIVGNRIVAYLTGFPSSATVTVLFNPNMDVAVSDATTKALSAVWETRSWAVVYDAAEAAPEVKKFLGLSVDPTADQIRLVVKQKVADSAADAAAIYQGEGFRSPALYVARTAAEAGGETFGLNPRYLLHFQAREGANFTPKDPSELLDPDRNHYGRVYIQDIDLNNNYATVGISIYGTVAHELFHAVQAGYDLSGKIWLKGVREGTATAYGDLLNRRHNGDPAATPNVRQMSIYPGQIKDETFKLENYLLIPGNDSYSNQDFFVYLARTVGNNDFDYLANVFEQMRLTIEDGAAQQADPASRANYLAHPPRNAVLKAFDTALDSVYGMSLSSAHEKFVRERAMEHNLASRFGRSAETESGFAEELFNNYSVKDLTDVQVIPKSATPVTVSSMNPLSTLSSRVLRIRPTAGAAAGDITITSAPSKGAFGTTLCGWIYRNGVPSALNATHAVSSFGSSASDELVVLLINPTFDQEAVGVTCTIKGSVDSGNPTTLSGTYPSITAAVRITDPNEPPVITATGSGSWSMTGTGIELLKDEELRNSDGILFGYDVVIYAPFNSQGTLTIANNAVWSSAPAEFRDLIQQRWVPSYHPLELLPVTGGNYSRVGGVTVSTSVTGSTITMDYVMPEDGSNSFQITPQFEAYYDAEVYDKNGVFVSSEKNLGVYTNFFHIYVSSTRTY